MIRQYQKYPVGSKKYNKTPDFEAPFEAGISKTITNRVIII
jgi:hypothetical protein